jgi:hypothetical protein
MNNYRKIAVVFMLAVSIQAFTQEKNNCADSTGLISDSRFLSIVIQNNETTSNLDALSDFSKSMFTNSALLNARTITATTERYNEDFQDGVLNLTVIVNCDSTTIEKYLFRGVDKFNVENFYRALEEFNCKKKNVLSTIKF